MRRTNRLLAFTSALAFLLQGSASVQPAAAETPTELAVVVNASVPLEQISPAELGAIYRGVLKQWSDGNPVIPLNLTPQSPARVHFDEVVLGLSPTEMGKYWIDQRIRGIARPPRHVNDPLLMPKVVRNLRGAIGYIPTAAVDPGLRVVAYIRGGRIEPLRP